MNLTRLNIQTRKKPSSSLSRVKRAAVKYTASESGKARNELELRKLFKLSSV